MKVTKKKFAESIIYQFLMDEENKDPKDIDINRDFSPAMITKSSSIAVAAEYLGLLNNDPEYLEYAKSRGGSAFQIFGKEEGEDKVSLISIISTRDILSLFPEE